MVHSGRRREFGTIMPLQASTTRVRRAGSAPAARLAWLALAASGLFGPGRVSAADPPPALAAPSSQPPGVVADWLRRNTSITPETVVSVGDEIIVAVLSSRPIDPASPRVLRLEIRAEMTDPDPRAAGPVRSLSATLDVNCADHSAHFIEVRTFEGANLTGAGQVRRPAEGWAADPRGSYFEDIDRAVCAPAAPRPLAGAEPAASRPPTPARTMIALRPAQSADAPLPGDAPAPTPPPVRPASASAAGQAQIIAAPSEDKAAAALSELAHARPALMKGLSTRIERIERNGVAYYRALVFGFAPPADASAFCRQLAAAGRACITR